MRNFNENIKSISLLLICLMPLAAGILELEDIDAYNEQICGKIGRNVRSNGVELEDSDGLLEYAEQFSTRQDISERLSNGWKAARGEIPWYVLLQIELASSTHTCGGTLISDNLVLTAAHCANPPLGTPDKIEVFLGATRRDETVETRTGIRACVPVGWGKTVTAFRDIGLIVLDRPVRYNDYVQPACLPKSAAISDVDCLAAGFGRLSDNPVQHSRDLMVLPMKKCRSHVSQMGLYDTCFTGSDRKLRGSPCKGDSGGGIFCKADGRRYAVGLVSRGGVNTCIKGKDSITALSDLYAQKPFLEDIFNECVNNKEQSQQKHASDSWH